MYQYPYFIKRLTFTKVTVIVKESKDIKGVSL